MKKISKNTTPKITKNKKVKTIPRKIENDIALIREDLNSLNVLLPKLELRIDILEENYKALIKSLCVKEKKR